MTQKTKSWKDGTLNFYELNRKAILHNEHGYLVEEDFLHLTPKFAEEPEIKLEKHLVQIMDFLAIQERDVSSVINRCRNGSENVKTVAESVTRNVEGIVPRSLVSESVVRNNFVHRNVPRAGSNRSSHKKSLGPRRQRIYNRPERNQPRPALVGNQTRPPDPPAPVQSTPLRGGGFSSIFDAPEPWLSTSPTERRPLFEPKFIEAEGMVVCIIRSDDEEEENQEEPQQEFQGNYKDSNPDLDKVDMFFPTVAITTPLYLPPDGSWSQEAYELFSWRPPS